jgi:3-deoxy-D-manno-octulosonic-acid transferase
MPLDTKKNAENFIKIVNPVKAIFVKYEYWYHFINTLYSHSIPTYIVSAKFYPNQHFFKFYGFWFRKILRKITYFFVQDDESKTLLNSIGIVNIIISGDTRFDRVYDILNNKKNIPLIDKFKNKNQILIAGSTWLKDEVLIVNFINQNQNNNIKYIIVPHEINQDRIDFLIKEIKTKTIRYSNLNEDNIKEANVIIVDSIGLLSSLYQYGDIAYIGGGFGKGIHNILEPAVFGLPIIFGTNYFRFKEAKDLVRKKGAFVIHNQTEFNNTINSLISENEKMSQAGNICKEYVAENIGATNKILEYIYN